MRLFRSIPAFVLLFASFACCATALSGEDGVPLTVDHKTQVPGATLKRGSYVIHLLDHLNDRMVIRVDDQSGKTVATFLAVPREATARRHAGMNVYSAPVKGVLSMRGFSFPDGTGVDFVYPKEDAVAIAQANGGEVPAIDPASEGRVAAKNLSKDDMALVTLWTLSPVHVGAVQKGISAKRYVTPTAVANADSATTPMSVTHRDAPLKRAQHSQQVAVSGRAPILNLLPHTAGYMALIWFLSGFSLLGAITMRLVAPKAREL